MLTNKQSQLFSSCLFYMSKRCFCTPLTNEKDAFKLVVVGGGAGGISMASRLLPMVGKENIAIIDPAQVHYYQPYFTLVGGGLEPFHSSYRLMSKVIPNGVVWIKETVMGFDPDKNALKTFGGRTIRYDFLIVAMGVRCQFYRIKGLPQAFNTPGVCSNYCPFTVNKTIEAIRNFKKGNAIFTQPLNPIKCAGAPQKIMYLAEEKFHRMKKRQDANILFYTALPTMFSVQKYSDALYEVAKKKGISVNFGHDLVEVIPEKKLAVFKCLENDTLVHREYEMLHISPRMAPPIPIQGSILSDSSGFLNVDKHTLQHKKYRNIFGIGDCTNLPTSKTAAAIASQCGVLTKNILSAIEGNELLTKYNGYTSCPLLTGYKKGILAEFDYDLQPLETFPFDQSKERFISYIVKKNCLPFLYWKLMLKGHWQGPEFVRKFFHSIKR